MSLNGSRNEMLRKKVKFFSKSFRADFQGADAIKQQPATHDTKRDVSDSKASSNVTPQSKTTVISGDTQTKEGALQLILTLKKYLATNTSWGFAGHKDELLGAINQSVFRLRQNQSYEEAWEGNGIALRCFKENRDEFKPDKDGKMPIRVVEVYSERIHLLIVRQQVSDQYIEDFFEDCYNQLKTFPEQLIHIINKCIEILSQRKKTQAAFRLNTLIFQFSVHLLTKENVNFPAGSGFVYVFHSRACLFVALDRNEALDKFLDSNFLGLVDRTQLEDSVRGARKTIFNELYEHVFDLARRAVESWDFILFQNIVVEFEKLLQKAVALRVSPGFPAAFGSTPGEQSQFAHKVCNIEFDRVKILQDILRNCYQRQQKQYEELTAMKSSSDSKEENVVLNKVKALYIGVRKITRYVEHFPGIDLPSEFWSLRFSLWSDFLSLQHKSFAKVCENQRRDLAGMGVTLRDRDNQRSALWALLERNEQKTRVVSTSAVTSTPTISAAALPPSPAP